MQNFHYVAVLLDQLYGINLDDADMEELGLMAWGYIGNRVRKLYKYTTTINPMDNSITLPCNALDINGESCVELVTTPYEEWNTVTNKTDLGDLSTAVAEQYIEASKIYQGPYYLPGKVLKYVQVKEKLYFTHNYGRVNVLYKGVIFDEDGLPEVTDKEAMAIATYIAYVQVFKEGLKTNNGDKIKLSQILEARWNKQCDQARVKHLSQNDFNQILEVSSSWDRKRFNFGYKPLR